MMDMQSWFRLQGIERENDNDQARDDRELIVNCCGAHLSELPFRSARLQGRQDYYLMLILTGELSVELPDGHKHMVPGSLIIYPPRAPLIYTAGGIRLNYLWLHWTGYLAESLLKSYGLPLTRVQQIADPSDLPRLERQFEQLFECFVTRGPLFELSAALQADRILHELARATGLQTASVPAGRSRVQKSIARIHRQERRTPSVSELAALENLSVSRFRSVFKACTQLSPQEYITRQRLQRACTLLSETDLTIRQAAAEAGFTDALYFSRLFRRRFGCPPSEWRNQVSLNLSLLPSEQRVPGLDHP